MENIYGARAAIRPGKVRVRNYVQRGAVSFDAKSRHFLWGPYDEMPVL